MKKNLTSIFLLFFSINIILYGCKTPELKFPLRSGQMVDDYNKSKRKSNRKYLYREITVQGTLSEMYKNKNDEVILILSDNKDAKGVKCTLDKEKQKITTPFRLNQKLTVKGFCIGYFETVEVKKCVIVPEK